MHRHATDSRGVSVSRRTGEPWLVVVDRQAVRIGVRTRVVSESATADRGLPPVATATDLVVHDVDASGPLTGEDRAEHRRALL